MAAWTCYLPRLDVSKDAALKVSRKLEIPGGVQKDASKLAKYKRKKNVLKFGFCSLATTWSILNVDIVKILLFNSPLAGRSFARDQGAR